MTKKTSHIRIDFDLKINLARLAKETNRSMSQLLWPLMLKLSVEDREKLKIPEEIINFETEKQLLNRLRAYSSTEISFSRNVLQFLVVQLNGHGYTINVKALLQNIKYHIEFAEKMKWKVALKDLKKYHATIYLNRTSDPKEIKKRLQQLRDSDQERRAMLIHKIVDARKYTGKRINQQNVRRTQLQYIEQVSEQYFDENLTIEEERVE